MHFGDEPHSLSDATHSAVEGMHAKHPSHLWSGANLPGFSIMPILKNVSNAPATEYGALAHDLATDRNAIVNYLQKGMQELPSLIINQLSRSFARAVATNTVNINPVQDVLVCANEKIRESLRTRISGGKVPKILMAAWGIHKQSDSKAFIRSELFDVMAFAHLKLLSRDKSSRKLSLLWNTRLETEYEFGRPPKIREIPEPIHSTGTMPLLARHLFGDSFTNLDIAVAAAHDVIEQATKLITIDSARKIGELKQTRDEIRREVMRMFPTYGTILAVSMDGLTEMRYKSSKELGNGELNGFRSAVCDIVGAWSGFKTFDELNIIKTLVKGTVHFGALSQQELMTVKAIVELAEDPRKQCNYHHLKPDERRSLLLDFAESFIKNSFADRLDDILTLGRFAANPDVDPAFARAKSIAYSARQLHIYSNFLTAIAILPIERQCHYEKAAKEFPLILRGVIEGDVNNWLRNRGQEPIKMEEVNDFYQNYQIPLQAAACELTAPYIPNRVEQILAPLTDPLFLIHRS